MVWREETLRSVYTVRGPFQISTGTLMLIHRQGILDDEAAELELARLHGLEGAKEKKLAMVFGHSFDIFKKLYLQIRSRIS